MISGMYNDIVSPICTATLHSKDTKIAVRFCTVDPTKVNVIVSEIAGTACTYDSDWLGVIMVLDIPMERRMDDAFARTPDSGNNRLSMTIL